MLTAFLFENSLKCSLLTAHCFVACLRQAKRVHDTVILCCSYIHTHTYLHPSLSQLIYRCLIYLFIYLLSISVLLSSFHFIHRSITRLRRLSLPLVCNLLKLTDSSYSLTAACFFPVSRLSNIASLMLIIRCHGYR